VRVEILALKATPGLTTTMMTVGMDVGGRWNGVEYSASGQTVAIAEMAMPEIGGRRRLG